jgi:hypothetical protein
MNCTCHLAWAGIIRPPCPMHQRSWVPPLDPATESEHIRLLRESLEIALKFERVKNMTPRKEYKDGTYDKGFRDGVEAAVKLLTHGAKHAR